jgi:hypothetical protein
VKLPHASGDDYLAAVAMMLSISAVRRREILAQRSRARVATTICLGDRAAV